ncbi:MAG: Helicase/secretion neighborhood CpaE-like protein [Frankiales bacterium]|nr:Helicase/secretion neighborhood CpaE-like protein [Frankiales bacterium]
MPRPLLVTADPDALDDLLRLAAAAGVEVDVADDVPSSRRHWATAPIVVIGPDLIDPFARSRPDRRPKVVVLGRDLDDGSIWQRAVEMGAEQVVFLPDAEPWLIEAFADAVEGGGSDGLLVAVVGGRGGAGATTLSAALAITAVRRDLRTLLVDGDPFGGGIDLVFGGELAAGLRWPELGATRGRVPAAALAEALPTMADLSVLSWDRGDPAQLPVEAVQAVLGAARRNCDLVVVDLPRSLDEASREVLATATTAVLLVPAEVRATAAAARVASGVSLLCRDLRLVVRGPAPGGLLGADVERALGLPLVGELRPEPGLDLALERGEPPARRARSPLAVLCDRLLDDLLGTELRPVA